MKSLFIFRRDFRIYDNHALIEAFKDSSEILLLFIFTPEQIKKNEYFSSNGFQFLIESLKDLNDQLNNKLFLIMDNNIKALKYIKKEFNFEAIYFNMDYTPYAIHRDQEIKEYCLKEDIHCHIYEDYLLAPIGTFLKKDETCYEVYSPFARYAKTFSIKHVNLYKIDKKKIKHLKNKIEFNDLLKFYKINPNIMVHGGTKNGLNILKNINKFSSYDQCRNILDYSTTHLSSYIKFGCISIRDVYHSFLNTFGIDFGVINQLYWREFYFYLIYYHPRILEKGESMKQKYDKIKWKNKPSFIEAWKNGRTGYPVVDAAMNQLNTEGFMHNRGRLVTSAVLIKILQCDWRIGEKYFAQQLIDYDPSVNNGNWQWGSSSGADSQPYFRIFNPWTQSKKFDPNCIYIKKWLPQLKNIPSKEIHQWDKYYQNYKNIDYNGPITSYEDARKETLEMYKNALN